MIWDLVKSVANLFLLRVDPACSLCKRAIGKYEGGLISNASHQNALGLREKQYEYLLCGECYRDVNLGISRVLGGKLKEHSQRVS